MTDGLDDLTEDEKLGAFYLLSEMMLRSILMSEGLKDQTAEALARRICHALPDVYSLTRKIEQDVVRDVMEGLEAEVVQATLERLKLNAKSGGDREFEPVDGYLYDEIDAKARALLERHQESTRQRASRFEASVIRANLPGKRSLPVRILTAEERVDAPSNA